MESRLERQLKKGVLEMLVLQLVCQGPTYGYELLTRMDKTSHGFFKVKEGTLYPILYRLQEQGLVKTRLAPAAANGGSKKYYSLTDKGRETLEELAAFWREYAACVDGFLQRWKEESP